MTCIFQKSNDAKWKKDGASKIQRAKIDIEEGKTIITISDVETGDSGKYSCEASNKAGNRFADARVKIMAGNLLNRNAFFLLPVIFCFTLIGASYYPLMPRLFMI